MRSFIAALRFLTILPLPGTYGSQERDLPGSVWFFPVVGLLLAAVAGAFALIVQEHVLPRWPGAVATAIVLLALSGGLHLDGLSDTADGFLSSRRRERVLEIMKDSHVGAMGVLAIVCTLLLKTASMAEFAWDQLWPRVVLMVLAGRCMMMLQILLLPYARGEGGLGAAFFVPRSWRVRLTGVIYAIGVLAAAAWFLQRLAGLVVVAIVVVVTLLFAALCRRKIGGGTGDTVGATCELAETFTALGFTIQQVAVLVEPDYISSLLRLGRGAP